MLSDKEIERLLSLTNGGDYGICPPPMDAQVAVYELCNFFLGENWYTAMPMGAEQVNTEIVFRIEELYQKSLLRKLYTR